MKRGEKGYTLVELLVVTAIIALVANATMMSLYQTLRTTENSDNQVTTITQVQNAGYWISLDARRAQTVEAEELGGTANVTVSWKQYESGDLEESGTYQDILYFALSGDGGNSWSDWVTAFIGNNPDSPFSYIIPAEYLTSDFRLRYYLNGPDGWIGYNEYAYIDDIAIAGSETIFSDDCSTFDSWDNGYDWQISSGRFRGHGDYDGAERYLTMNTSQDLTQTQLFQFPLTFTWATWTETGGNEYEVTYTLANGELRRSYSVDGGAPTETLIAQHIDPDNTYCTLGGNELTAVITASLGGGLGTSTETREFRILTRPD